MDASTIRRIELGTRWKIRTQLWRIHAASLIFPIAVGGFFALFDESLGPFLAGAIFGGVWINYSVLPSAAVVAEKHRIKYEPEELVEERTKRPILFLRAFNSDLGIQSSLDLTRRVHLHRIKDNPNIRKITKVIGDKFPFVTAATAHPNLVASAPMWVELGEDWVSGLSSWLRRMNGVVFFLDRSAAIGRSLRNSLEKELSAISANFDPCRLLLLFGETDSGNAADLYSDSRDRIQDLLNCTLPRQVPSSGMLTFNERGMAVELIPVIELETSSTPWLAPCGVIDLERTLETWLKSLNSDWGCEQVSWAVRPRGRVRQERWPRLVGLSSCGKWLDALAIAALIALGLLPMAFNFPYGLIGSGPLISLALGMALKIGTKPLVEGP